MRKVNRIILHCTSGHNTQTTQSIKDYWKNDLGWSQVGYHKLISDDGTIEDLLSLDKVSNGVKGYNSDSVNICYKGGLKVVDGKKIYTDTRSRAQKEAFITAIEDTLTELKKTQEIDHIRIVGHRDLSPDLNGNGTIETREWIKDCPCFDAFDMDEYGWIMGNKALELIKKGRQYY